MQDSTFEAFDANNAFVNNLKGKIAETVNTPCETPPTTVNVPSIAMFEASLRERLEIFALDTQEALSYSVQTDVETLKEQLELQLNQLQHLLNEVHLLSWHQATKHLPEDSQ